MKRNELVLLDDILENINDIEEFSKNLTRNELEKNKLKQKAIVRSLEIIGEAAKNISSQTKEKCPEIEWKNITGARNVFVHAYFVIDNEVIWRVIKDKLPILKKQIQKIKEDLEKK
ncbi:DUF86 domain-containing protein [Candidatus Woesearchaeota archaeon]|nr:DUF86 domain-containing protein [Candidatus Woesearchaeota archaeon]